MPSNSHLSYDDVREALDAALASDKGIRIRESTPARLISLRQRIHKLKSLERKRSRQLYPPGDPKHGTSIYDKLSVLTSDALNAAEKSREGLAKVPVEELYLEIVKRQPGMLQIEELT